MKRKIKAMILMVVAVVIIMTVPALALSTSGKITVTVYGYTYTYYTAINSYSTGVTAYANIECTQAIPTGYAGAKACVYGDAQGLIEMSDIKYNTSSASKTFMNILNYSTTDDNLNTYYRAEGDAYFYNGGDYKQYTMNASPFVVPGSSTSSVVLSESTSSQSWGYNNNGEVYGAKPVLDQLGIQADLILAYGKNGKIGYIKTSDLNYGIVNSPEEAIAYMETLPDYREIPLYAQDGETIIDTFLIDNTIV